MTWRWRFFAAYFARRRNVSDVEVLADVAGTLGLDRDEASRVLESGERADGVRQKEAFWSSRGISAVPAMIFERRHLVSGAQGEANYKSILEQIRAAGAV